MNQADQNINKDMFDSDLIDVESLDFSDDQTWLYTVPDDSGQKVDIVDWNLSCDWPNSENSEYLEAEKQLIKLLDSIIKSDILSLPDKHKFDSRTYVKPKKRVLRPSIHNIMEVASNPSSMSPHSSLGLNAIAINPAIAALNPALNPALNSNKYMTYNKYNSPLGPISPMLRLKTFNVDVNTENSSAVKDYASKRRSLVQDDDPQLEDIDVTLLSETSGCLSMEHTPSKPIDIDLSQPAHNLHNTFNKGLTNMLNERGSLNMYQSGESLMRMSPPSLVSSLLMESSGTFNPESIENRKSIPDHRDSGFTGPMSGRDSIDPMMTSMTLSILDEKDMSTSFLSQTTYPDNDSLMDSLPPSLVSSVNSSYVVSTTSKPRENNDSNIFSSATFTHLEQSERLLSARPRCQLYNSFTKREPSIRNSESYTKSREEACQIDTVKVLNENSDKKESPKTKPNVDMAETITLHYANNKFRDAEKENFERDDAFYKDMNLPKPEDAARNSLNVTLGKQELNEIIQARQKLSLARKALPSEPDKPLPNQVDTSPIKTIQLPHQTITVPRQSMENASELLSRRRAINNGFDRPEESIRENQPPREIFQPSKESYQPPRDTHQPQREMYQPREIPQPPRENNQPSRETHHHPRETHQSPRETHHPPREVPKRNATFKKVSPKASAMDTTVVYLTADDSPASDTNIIDINSATVTLLGDGERTLNQEDWGSQERAMVGSSESTDTGTFSSSSPPDSVPDAKPAHDSRTQQIASTPLMGLRKGVKNDLLNLHTAISPIYDMVDDKSYTVTKVSSNAMERTYDMNNTTVINSGTIVKKTAKRDILTGKTTPDKKLAPTSQMKSPNRVSPTGTASYGSMVPPTGLPRQTSLPTSKLRQYSSHRELSRIPAGPPAAARGAPPGRSMLRRNVYASNPALSPTAPAPGLAYTMELHKEEDKPPRPTLTNPPALVRQGTETLRRERPQSQLVAPRDAPTTRTYSIAGTTQLRATQARPTSGPVQKPAPPPVTEQPRPASSSEARISALPRPTRLPAPRRAHRPPSVYSVAPSADADHY